MKYFDETNHFPIGDTSLLILNGAITDEKKLEETLSRHIISASGWRSVYAKSGEEEDSTPDISDENKIIVTAIARTFFKDLGMKKPRVLVGIDARPTGEVLASILIKDLIALGAEVDYLFISAAPEIMAYSNTGYDAFAYISASHNPIGHNGFKFGGGGGVYAKERAEKMGQEFLNLVKAETAESALELEKNCPINAYEEVLKGVSENKKKALEYYRAFILKTAGLDESFSAKVGIVAELNGSARGASIDKAFLRSIGCTVKALNDTPRQVIHAIVPEGENLELCRKTLEDEHKKNSVFAFGYTPDNDGDRGNFVYIDTDGKAKILAAQEVFALVCSIEIADAAFHGKENIAIAVNGPTSMRIDEMASAFGAKVFRAEVGEANAVNLASELRAKGMYVHIYGEGSNGGNITDPAKVRDPLNSVMTILKFLSNGKLFAFMCEKLKAKNSAPSIPSLLSALPVYTTTGAFSTLAKMHIRNTDFMDLKGKYEAALKASFPIAEMTEEGITGYEIYQTEGTLERKGEGSAFRTGKAKGGLKVMFLKADGSRAGYMWFRPSGTEPVLRILADIKGNKKALHDAVLAYQRALIEKADNS
jgi:Phosphomannomutase